MLTFIGILVISLGITSIIWNNFKRQADEQDVETRKYNEENSPHYPKELKNMPAFPINIKPIFLFILGIIIIGLNGLFFWADAGTAYAVQYPWGGDEMIKTQGLKFKGWGRVIPLSYEISIKDIIPQLDEEGVEKIIPESEDGIYNRTSALWEFSDAIKAKIATAVIVGINVDDEEIFLNMADRNRSESKLIHGRVIPNIDAALKNTCKLMDAQEYISGKASDFDRYFRDQLENGMYLVEEYTAESIDPEVIGDTTTVRTIKTSNTNKQTKYRIKKDSQGNIIRDNKSNTLKQYGVVIYQAQVTGIDWEDSFDARLQLQKEQVAQTQLEKQEAEKEFFRAKKEIAKGESEKAAERAKLEKEQIKLTIAAETEAKVAEQNLIAERKKLEVAKLSAQSKKVAVDAQYYENAKLVSAGLTPQEKAKLELDKADVVSRNLATMKVPSNMIIGGNGSGNSTEALLQIKLFNDIIGK
jgi:regulator of protease activity HflC (stomatin/prohibitin superfamily)